MIMKYTSLFSGIAMSLILLSSCKKDEEAATLPTTNPTPEVPTAYGQMSLRVDHKFGNQAYTIGTFYTNAAGEQISFNKTKYYINYVTLMTATGAPYEIAGTCHLVDLADPASLTLNLENVPTGTYTSARFTIGLVDENLPTDMVAMSTADQMYWADSQEFIFIRVEGYSPVAQNGQVKYILGGDEAPNVALNEPTVAFTEQLTVTEEGSPELAINLDMARIFNGPAGNVSIASTPLVQAPSANAVMVADNFASGFSFGSIVE
jgi:hypothetical protein